MRRALSATVVALIALAVGSWLWGRGPRAEARYRQGLRDAEVAAKGGSLARARQILEATAAGWPGRGEAEFLLGSCEQAMGRTEAARAAWGRVPADSPSGPNAAMMLARLALAGDRMAEAERHLTTALDAPDPLGREARESSLMLLKLQGRIEEARRLVRDGWGRYADRVGLLQQLWRLDTPNPLPLHDHRAIVERAGRSAPDDDRVGLARARLALRTGLLEESARWLGRCQERRPGDPAVWRGWLDWARAAGDAARARLALEHLDPALVPPAEILDLRAWFAARAGDREAERRALEGLVALAPGARPALDRLAALAAEAGDDAEVARLRARQAAIDDLVDKYTERMFQADPAGDAEALAARAEALGRAFEARGWWALAEARGSLDRVARDEALGRIAGLESRRAAGPGLAWLRADLGRVPSGPAGGALAAGRGPAGPDARFVDDAEAAGLRFTFETGRTPERQIPETMGGGIGLLDVNGDGRLDVYLAQGGPFPPVPEGPAAGGDRLFRNRGDGTFEDVTEASGIAGFRRGYGHGVAVGDSDNDGDPDLFVTRWGAYALYRNNGDGTFVDATAEAGLGGDRDWPTSAAFADLDNDGDLDLYVCHYLVWDAGHPRVCPDERGGSRNLLCNPGLYPSRPDRLFRNDGGRFVDVTAEAGIVDEHGRGLGVVACDLDDDGLIDLFVANDQTANFLWRNLGGLKFEEVGHLAGVAAGAAGGYQAGMGVACGDLDGDGRPDLAVTNYYNEGTSLYRNLGRGLFADISEASGLSAVTRPLLGFGLTFLDADNDGRLDLAQANGHVDDFRPASPYAMPALLMRGDGRGRLADARDRAGPPWGVDRLGRALVAGDLDNDGRLDLLLLALDGPLAYFRNRTEAGHSATFALEGTASNRDAVGARVAVEAGGARVVGWRLGGGSYQASADPRVHLGLGAADRMDAVEVRWPSGRVDRFEGLPADRVYAIREGDPTPRPLPEARVPGP